MIKTFDGEVGIYVKQLSTDEVFSYNAYEPWYFASAIKLPVAIELYRQLAAKQVSAHHKVKIVKSDYRDGAGKISWLRPGTTVSIGYILKQMLIESDNAATDILIRELGLTSVNQNLQNLVPWGFGPITSLLDVRKLAYGELHPSILTLSNLDFIEVKKSRSSKEKLKTLSKLTKTPIDQFKLTNINIAFENYYRKGFNTGSIAAYSKLLAMVAKDELPKPNNMPPLIEIMSESHTGKRRIISGLPKDFRFAHKTGTQRNRVCDLGVAYLPNQQNHVIIAACAKNFKHRRDAEKLLKNIGKSVSQSGVFKI